MNNGEILKVQGLNVSYGESKVLFDAGLRVMQGQVGDLRGSERRRQNHFAQDDCGFFEADLRIGPLRRYRPGRSDVLRHRQDGAQYIPQDKKVFSDLTVRENLELGSYATKDYNWDQVTEHFPRLKGLMDRKAGYLSGGERQMLMIGRAILGKPKVLLIDEPTEGLAPSIVAHLKNAFKELSKKSALVIVEQNLPLVCAISDKIYALKEGHMVAELADRESIQARVCEQYL